MASEISIVLPPVPLTKLVTLRALLTTQSVSETARQLRRAQPSITGVLGEMRRHYGDALLIRDGPGMRRTPFAERLLPRLDVFAADAEQLLAERPEFDPTTDRRHMRVAATDYQAGLLATKLTSVLSTAPKLTLDIRPYPSAMTALSHGDVALALLTGGEPDLALRPSLVAEDPFVMVFDPAYTSSPGTVAEFADADFIQASPAGLPGGLLDDALAARGLTRNVRLTVGPLFLALQLLRGSGAVSVLPESLAAEGMAFGLTTAPLPIAIPPAVTWLVRARRTEGDPATEWVAQVLFS